MFKSHETDKVLLYKLMFGSLRRNVNLYIAMMAKTYFLTILLTVTCFLGGVVSVTDKEFEVCIEPIVIFRSDFKFAIWEKNID